jgi:LmbE family N-acetylglucosaminyl deacetylase
MEQDYIPYHAEINPPQGNVLILAPHPDDEVFGCGAIIMRHLAQGDAVSVIIATDGHAAVIHDNEQAKQNYILNRYQESKNAAQILGYEDLHFWEFPDRGLKYNSLAVEKTIQAIQTFQAALVYAPSIFEIHPDHFNLAQIAIDAVITTKSNLMMYEIGIPLHPNFLLDMTDLKERKRQAMQCFFSQTQLNDYISVIESLNIYRTYTLPENVKAAEGFYQISGEILQETPLLRFGKTRQTELQMQHKPLFQRLLDVFNG